MKDKKSLVIVGAALAFLVVVLFVLPNLGGNNGPVEQEDPSMRTSFTTLDEFESFKATSKLLRPDRNEDWIYNIYDNRIEIVEYIGEKQDIIIPAELPSGTDSMEPVYSMLPGALSEKEIRNVIVSSGLVDLGDNAFSGSTIEHIAIPNTVLAIGVGAFSGCSELKKVKLGDNITHIGDSAFAGCSSLTAVNAPKNIKSYGEACFAGCSSIIFFEIPGIEVIPSEFLSGCTNLTVVKIDEMPTPTDLTEEELAVWQPNRTIGSNAFSGCPNLASLYITEDIVNIAESIVSLDDGLRENTLKTLVISGFISSSAAVYASNHKIVFNPVDLEEFEATGNVVIKLKNNITKLEKKYTKIDEKGHAVIPYEYSKDFFKEVIDFSDDLVAKKLIENYTVSNAEYTATLINGQIFTESLNVSNVVEE